MTKLSTIPDHTLSITCGLCKHHSMLEVANLILVVGEEATVHDVRKQFRCKQCNVKDQNTFQIVWRGNSDIALDGRQVVKFQDTFFKSYFGKVTSRTSHTSQTTPDTPIGVCRVVSPLVNNGNGDIFPLSPSCRLVA